MSILNLKNKIIQISDEDFEYVQELSWHVVKTGKHTPIYYVRHVNKTKKIHIMLHRYIMEKMLNRKLEKTELIDHINGDPFDNRRENLRIVNRHQSKWNTKVGRNNKSTYKGVIKCRNDKMWISQIVHNQKRIRLGTFRTAILAAEKYDDAANHYYGEYARLNFPNRKPEQFIPHNINRPIFKRFKNCSSQYIGVHKKPSGKYCAQIRFDKGKTKTLGTFDNEEDAAKAYDKEMVERYGPGNEINFPKK